MGPSILFAFSKGVNVGVRGRLFLLAIAMGQIEDFYFLN